MSDIHDTIKDQVSQDRVVLYMKGTPQFPQCGFSATVAEVLKRCGLTEYKSFNVLQDESGTGSKAIRTGRRFRSSTSMASSSADATSSARCTRPASCNSCWPSSRPDVSRYVRARCTRRTSVTRRSARIVCAR